MSKYQMPPIEVSETVQWAVEPGAAWEAAIVTAVAEETIEVARFPARYHGCIHVAGVRHESDPNFKVPEPGVEIGVWRRAPSDIKA